MTDTSINTSNEVAPRKEVTADPGPWGSSKPRPQGAAPQPLPGTLPRSIPRSIPSARLVDVLAGPLGLIALAASLGLENELHRHFLVALSVALFALAFRGAGSSSTRISQDTRTTPTTMQHDNAPTTEAAAPLTSSSHVLIEGTFDGLDAQEILLSMLNSKIDYHTRRTFSSMERFGEPDQGSERRLEQLRSTRTAIREALAKAIEGRQSVRIDSTVRITIGA